MLGRAVRGEEVNCCCNSVVTSDSQGGSIPRVAHSRILGGVRFQVTRTILVHARSAMEST